MHEQTKQGSTENHALGRRLVQSLPSLFVFFAMVYIGVWCFRSGVPLSRVPVWMQVPFFLYGGLTILIGLLAIRPLFPSKRREDASPQMAAEAVDNENVGEVGGAEIVIAAHGQHGEPVRAQGTSDPPIVIAVKVASSIFLFACSAVIFALILVSSYGRVGATFFGVIATTLLILSLKWPLTVLYERSKARGTGNVPNPKKTWRLVFFASLTACVAVLQTLAVPLYRDRIVALIFTALCWMWASSYILQLFRLRRQSQVMNGNDHSDLSE